MITGYKLHVYSVIYQKESNASGNAKSMKYSGVDNQSVTMVPLEGCG